jgi:hypothetical protein
MDKKQSFDDLPTSKIDFYRAKKTLEEFVKELQQKLSEGVHISPISYGKSTEPVTITHQVESAQLNKGNIIDLFDLFCEYYPEKKSFEEKGIHKFVDRYNFTHSELVGELSDLKKIQIAVGYNKGAVLMTKSDSTRIGPHISVTFTSSYLDRKDLDFNMALYDILVSVEVKDEKSCIEQLIGLGVGYEKDISAHTWDRLAGYEETKKEMVDRIIRPNLDSKIFQNLWNETRKEPQQATYNCYLLKGTYGVGKTESGKIIANELGYKFFEVSMQSVFEKWYGQSSRNLSNIFKNVRKVEKALLFLDELDCLSGNRDGKLHEESQRVLAVLMTETAKTRVGDGLTIVGTTNKPQNLDGAIRRRFKNEIDFPLPTHESLVKIYQHYAKQLPMGAVKKLAERSGGFSPYDVLCVCDNAEKRFIADFLENPSLKGTLPDVKYYIQSLEIAGIGDLRKYIL